MDKYVENLAVRRLEQKRARLLVEVDYYQRAINALGEDEAVPYFSLKQAVAKIEASMLEGEIAQARKDYHNLNYYYRHDHHRLTYINTLTAKYSATPDENGQYHAVLILWEHINNVLQSAEIGHETFSKQGEARLWLADKANDLISEYDPEWVEPEEIDDAEWEREHSRNLWS